MKQKAVIKVYLKDNKSRSKALKVVVSAPGIGSAGWRGPNEDEIELEGDDVDIINVTTSLRKRVGPAELVSVSPVKPDSDAPAPDPAGSGSDCTFYPIGGGGGYRFPQPAMYVAIPDYSDQYSTSPPGCSIM